ncbi:MAG: hypothetical protein JWO05_1515 [Gemmatimonadetes bacterium]|nr:hypothetical protein [Gemmatimonadota bacterium]
MISVEGISAGAGARPLTDVSLVVPQGSYGVVIGPAGAGKTTLLEAIAGIVPLRAGRVHLSGEDVTTWPPEERRLSLVYQHAWLFPHLDVAQNVAYGEAEPGVADAMIERFGLQDVRDHDVRVLSGGERQLVALARALAHRPEVLLLDEPFGALDPRRRAAVRREVRTIYYERRFTVLHVTHDFAEAGALGDTLAVLDGGRLLQQGAPEMVLRKPATPWIAEFVGAENVFAGDARPIRDSSPDWRDGDDLEQLEHAVAFNTGALTLYALGHVLPGPAHAVIRAEEVMLSLGPRTTSVRNQFHGIVSDVTAAGALTRVTVQVTGTPIVAALTTRSAGELDLAPGREVWVAFKAMSVHLC